MDSLLLDRLKYSVRNPRTLRSFRYAINCLKKSAGEKPAYNTDDAIKAIESMKSQSSKRTMFYLLKKLYKIAGWEWDNNVLSAPPEEDWEERKITYLDKERVEEMIRNAHKLDDLEQLILMFSTVWGMRRIEIVEAFKHEDTVSFEDTPSIYIRTAKKGMKRRFLIPDEILNIARKFKPYKIGEFNISRKFHEIMFKTTGEIKPGFGYHSIRRSLIVLLLPPHTTLTETEVFRFLRWSEMMAGAKSILYRYAFTASQKEWFELDRKIYEQHPWLGAWKDVSSKIEGGAKSEGF